MGQAFNRNYKKISTPEKKKKHGVFTSNGSYGLPCGLGVVGSCKRSSIQCCGPWSFLQWRRCPSTPFLHGRAPLARTRCEEIYFGRLRAWKNSTANEQRYQNAHKTVTTAKPQDISINSWRMFMKSGHKTSSK